MGNGLRPGQATLRPLIDAWLIDGRQPGLAGEPYLLRAVARSLDGEAVHLDTLFEQPAHYPNVTA